MNYVVVDIETTGKSDDGEGITEIAAIKISGSEIKKFHSLIKPRQSITPFVQNLTGISNEMVADAPSFSDIHLELFEFLEGAIFVAHNVNFDLGFIQRALLENKIWYDPDHLCTVQASRQILKGEASYSLGKLCKSIGIELNNRHRAMGDAEATHTLLKRLIDVPDNNIASFVRIGGTSVNLPAGINKNEMKNLMGRSGWLALLNKEGHLLTGMIGGDLYTVWKNYCKRFKIKPKKWNSIHSIIYEYHSSKLLSANSWSSICKSEKPLWQKQEAETQLVSLKDGNYLERWGNRKTFHRIKDGLLINSQEINDQEELDLYNMIRHTNEIKVCKRFELSLKRGQLKYLN